MECQVPNENHPCMQHPSSTSCRPQTSRLVCARFASKGRTIGGFHQSALSLVCPYGLPPGKHVAPLFDGLPCLDDVSKLVDEEGVLFLFALQPRTPNPFWFGGFPAGNGNVPNVPRIPWIRSSPSACRSAVTGCRATR